MKKMTIMVAALCGALATNADPKTNFPADDLALAQKIDQETGFMFPFIPKLATYQHILRAAGLTSNPGTSYYIMTDRELIDGVPKQLFILTSRGLEKAYRALDEGTEMGADGIDVWTYQYDRAVSDYSDERKNVYRGLAAAIKVALSQGASLSEPPSLD